MCRHVAPTPLCSLPPLWSHCACVFVNFHFCFICCCVDTAHTDTRSRTHTCVYRYFLFFFSYVYVCVRVCVCTTSGWLCSLCTAAAAAGAADAAAYISPENMAHTKNYSQHRTNFALYFSLQFRTAAFCLCNVPHTHTNTPTQQHTHTPRTHTHRVAWAIFTHYITRLPYNFAAFLWRQSITAAAQAMSIDRDLSHRQTHKHTHTHVMACVT